MGARILIADDHEVVRQGIRMILKARPDWEICGEASDGAETIRMALELQPDAIIMDITMPVTSGLVATREITNLGSNVPILAFTMHDLKGLAESIKSAGGRGLVFKSDAGRDLIQALEALLHGGTYFRSEVVEFPVGKEDKNPKMPGPA